MDNIRQWLVSFKSLSDMDRRNFEYSTRPELLRELRFCLADAESTELQPVIAQLFKFWESESGKLKLFVYSVIPYLANAIVQSSLDIPSGVEALTLCLYNGARVARSKELHFPSTHREIHSIYYNPGVLPGRNRQFKLHYKRISYKEKVLSGDRDEVLSVLLELFRERIEEMDDLILKEFCLTLQALLDDQSEAVARYPLFLHSAVHLLFQLYNRFNPNRICNKLLEQIQAIAERELHLELLLAANSVISLLSAFDGQSEEEISNFMTTPDLRQCRAIKNITLKQMEFSKDEDQQDYLSQMKEIKRESLLQAPPAEG